MTRPKPSTDGASGKTQGGAPDVGRLSNALPVVGPQTLFDREVFEEFRDTIGDARMRGALEDLSAMLRKAFRKSPRVLPGRERTFEVAHILVARAGMMGFTALRDACVDLQQACATQAPFSDEYRAACKISQPSQYAIASLLKRLP